MMMMMMMIIRHLEPSQTMPSIQNKDIKGKGKGKRKRKKGRRQQGIMNSRKKRQSTRKKPQASLFVCLFVCCKGVEEVLSGKAR